MGEESHKYGMGRGNRPQRENPGRRPALASRNTLSAAERRKRGEARLRTKGNINSGLTKAQEAAVTKTENRLRNLRTERSVVIGKDGREVFKSTSGSRKRTGVYAVPDSVITHNHPSSVRGSSTRYGSSLSGADGFAAIHFNASEVRAVSGSHTYSLRRPATGWPVNARQYQSEWDAARKKHSATLDNYIREAKDANDLKRRLQRANTLMSHMATKDVARKYGMEYTRRRTK